MFFLVKLVRSSYCMLCYVKHFDLSEPEESHDQVKIFLAGQHDWQQFQIYFDL